MDISVPFDFYSLYFVVYETIITCGIPQPRVSDPI